jgi:hypothetical protein
VKKGEEAMEILEAYDLTGSLRGAAALAGCDHKTVARLVAARDAAGGALPVRERRRPLVDPFAEKIDQLVDRSRAQVRADKAHGVLVAMGYWFASESTPQIGVLITQHLRGFRHHQEGVFDDRAGTFSEQ